MKLSYIIICKRCSYIERCENSHNPEFGPEYPNRLDLIKDIIFGVERCSEKIFWETKDKERSEKVLEELSSYSNPFNYPSSTMI